MLENQIKPTRDGNAGFSLIELIIAMTITLAVLVAATTLLATSLRTRARENTRSEALAAAQRALNVMSREIANAGYGLTDNGIVIADSGPNSIRVRANMDNDDTLADNDEDVRYVFQGGVHRAIVRFDSFPAPSGISVVLASRIDGLTLTYLDLAGAPISNPANYGAAERIRIEVWVDLPAGPEQPASVVRLVSEVALRNAPNTLQQF
jgi:prepilin-type N-terminal cleavage/methylation domain-containing protein